MKNHFNFTRLIAIFILAAVTAWGGAFYAQASNSTPPDSGGSAVYEYNQESIGILRNLVVSGITPVSSGQLGGGCAGEVFPGCDPKPQYHFCVRHERHDQGRSLRHFNIPNDSKWPCCGDSIVIGGIYTERCTLYAKVDPFRKWRHSVWEPVYFRVCCSLEDNKHVGCLSHGKEVAV